MYITYTTTVLGFCCGPRGKGVYISKIPHSCGITITYLTFVHLILQCELCLGPPSTILLERCAAKWVTSVYNPMSSVTYLPIRLDNQSLQRRSVNYHLNLLPKHTVIYHPFNCSCITPPQHTQLDFSINTDTSLQLPKRLLTDRVSSSALSNNGTVSQITSLKQKL